MRISKSYQDKDSET